MRTTHLPTDAVPCRPKTPPRPQVPYSAKKHSATERSGLTKVNLHPSKFCSNPTPHSRQHARGTPTSCYERVQLKPNPTDLHRPEYKLSCRMAVKDPEFEILWMLRRAAEGNSFSSGVDRNSGKCAAIGSDFDCKSGDEEKTQNTCKTQ